MKKVKRKGTSLFHPDAIQTQLASAVSRDLGFGGVPPDPQLAELVYGLTEDPALYFAYAQASQFSKKYESEDVDSQLLEDATYDKFFSVVTHMESVNRSLAFYLPSYGRVTRDTSVFGASLIRARSLVHAVLGPRPDTDRWYELCRNSSGSSLGVRHSATAAEFKLALPITATIEAAVRFDDYLEWDKELAHAIANMNESRLDSTMYRIVDSSRATTVPKNNSIRRMIAVEPTANMFLQQGLGRLMTELMEVVVGFDISVQAEQNQQLAWLASITGRYATIDFSSASDCVAIALLRWLLPPVWFHALDSVRCKSMVVKGATLELPMFSTMGNATTFPIETLVFWALGAGLMSLVTDPTTSRFTECEAFKLMAVFGDDCIVPERYADDFCQLATEVGFLVNNEKSFLDGKFRESCGGDFLDGRNVRPYFIRAPHNRKMSSIEPWLYTIWNRINKKYIQYFGSLTYLYDKEVYRVLLRLFRRFHLKVRLVPDGYPEDAGLQISSDLARWRSVYSMEFHPIKRDVHGTMSFSFCRFQYKQSDIPEFPDVRYWMWKKERPLSQTVRCLHDGDLRKWKDIASEALRSVHLNFKVQNETEQKEAFVQVKRIGGYVVGTGLSCHWAPQI